MYEPRRTVSAGAAAMIQNQAKAAACTAAGARRVDGNQAMSRSRSSRAGLSASATRAATAWKYLRGMRLGWDQSGVLPSHKLHQAQQSKL